ncbi:hypothetical protein [Ruminococcus gauvreauii]|uniref:Ig-like domain-containing protein n=1 Tax=Ruminococcus gauvreauii TaxID=438033 RepID=A0ABY5VCN2_9FIRM|nr:hypothetical protein [Ruminococcus gauvreauii]UWP58047.1 hypothetical protein NQ502_11665 [Ruminococcus gauvreauii]
MKGKTKRYGKVFMSLILALGMIFGNISAVLAADYSLGSGIKTGDSKQLQSGDKITAGSDSVFQVVQNGKVVYPSEGAIKGYEDEAQTKESGRSYGKGSYTLPAAESGKVWNAAAAQNKDWFYDEANAKMRQGAYVITLEQTAEPKEQPKEEPKEQPKEEQQAPPVKAAVDAETPVITGNPAAATYDKDAPAAALRVTASVSDGGTLSYQWYQSTDAAAAGDAIQGAVSSEYTPGTGTAGTTTYYYCVVTNTNDAATGEMTAAAVSARAAITVNEPAPPVVDAETPVITGNPADATYDKGTPAAALVVTATVNAGNLSYQWYQSADADSDGTAIQGAASSEYTPGTETVGTTYYYCVVTNTDTNVAGSQTATAESGRAAITVNDTPLIINAATPDITADPVDAAYDKDETANPLSVTATVTDGGTLSYQWYQSADADSDGTAIQGATNSEYTPGTGTVGTTYYYCVVTNTNDAVTGEKTATVASARARVTVNDNQPAAPQTPQFTGHPQSKKDYNKGDTAVPLSVTAEVTDGGALSYQWYQNTSNDITTGTKIEGATEKQYTPKTDKAGTVYYYCIVTNTKDQKTASASSNAAEIVVMDTQKTDAKAPKITGNPKGASYITDAAAKALQVKAESLDGGKLSYQWYSNTKNSTKDGTAIKDATESTYTPSTKKNGTVYYYCVVTNTNKELNGNQTATAVSDTAKIVVSARKNAETPSVSGPNNATYYKGKAAKAMEVKASVKDGGTLSYQWYSNTKNSTKDGSVIKDATKSTYTPSTASVGTTYYYCVVTNTNKSVNGDQTVSITSRAAKITVKASTSKASPVKRTLNTKSTRAANAKTGDETNLMLWIALLAAAGIVIAVLAVRIKRNRK